MCVGGCYDDMADIEDVLEVERGVTYVDGDIAGRIVDEADKPLADIAASILSDNMTTQAQGFIALTGSKIRQQHALLQFTSPDGMTYYHTSPAFVNDTYHNTWQIWRNTTQTPVGYLEGYQVSLNPNCGLDIKQDGLLLNDVPQNGPIQVDHYFINENVADFFPEALASRFHQEMIKMKYGFHFDIKNDSGQQLSFNKNTPTTLSINTISIEPTDNLYYFNEDEVRWELVENASKTNSSITADISHIGYYCIGSPYNIAYLSGNVSHDARGLAGLPIEFTDEQSDWQTTAQASFKGNFMIAAPANTSVKLALKNGCDEIAHTESIDILEENIDDKTIALPAAQHIKGQIKNCQNEIVEQSFFFLGNDQFIYSPTGKLDEWVLPCNQDMELYAASTLSEQIAQPFSWKATDENHIQSIFLCDDVKDSYIMLAVDDDVSFYDMSSTASIDGRLTIEATNDAQSNFEFLLKVTTLGTGAVNDNEINITLFDAELGNEGYSLYCPNSTAGCGFENFEVTHYGTSSEEWITGTFEGTFWMLTTNNSPQVAYNRKIIGEFRLPRDF